jgi:UDP:flavonoid glycosyltransferase YjiC (YdhE family)
MLDNRRDSEKYRIAFFISPHGFGHAARAAGIMEALHEIDAGVGFEIFTRVPISFFQDSLAAPFAYHSALTDIGLAQKSPLNADLKKTLQNLNNFLPFRSSRVDRLAKQLSSLNCDLMICDIAPLGIAVARKAGIPSVLVENFTWDWIYQGYTIIDKKIERHVDYLQKMFNSVDFRIQTQPVCRYHAAAVVTRPISRKCRRPAESYRKTFGIASDKKIVLITMGGITQEYAFLNALGSQQHLYFIILGKFQSIARHDNMILLPHPTHFHHPDLVNAADAVIGKVGYGTLAEAYWAGVPFGYISRPNFRESQKLARFIQREMTGIPIAEDDFYSGDWISVLPGLLKLRRIRRRGSNGAHQAAVYIKNFLDVLR